jgi:hypothetical protein
MDEEKQHSPDRVADEKAVAELKDVIGEETFHGLAERGHLATDR